MSRETLIVTKKECCHTHQKLFFIPGCYGNVTDSVNIHCDHSFQDIACRMISKFNAKISDIPVFFRSFATI